jgi:pyruvate dehydrogenase E1 component alpha subunit
MKDVYNGTIKYMQILDADGNMDASLCPKDITDQKLIELYKAMSFARALDVKALSLQRQGRAVTYAPTMGEEATQIGTAAAMRQNDIFVPNFRQQAVFLYRKATLESIMLYWRGYEDSLKDLKSINAFPVAVPVSTQMPHGAGAAYAQKYKKTGNAVLAYVGDGGTSEGDFYETINFAGVMKLPLVVIIENNQWAISVPRALQTAAPTLAQKAIAAGIPGMQVDGNDIVAVYAATRDAILNSKDGPTVIECITYRMSLHTTADDPTKYRPDSDVEAWKPKDPLLRVRKYLEKKGLWDDKKDSEMSDEQISTIDEAVVRAEEFRPDPRSMFENVYSTMPQVLKDEEDEAIAEGYWQEGV